MTILGESVRIEEILDGLADDAKVQPLVYALFEQADPESVKKTVENLQRTLEFKSEEVKKALSLNHDHLFSCTDLIDELRTFVDHSKAGVKKMKALNDKVNASLADQGKAEDQDGEVIGIDLSKSTVINETFAYLHGLAKSEYLKAVEGFLGLNYLPLIQNHVELVKSLWITLLVELAKSIKKSLFHGKPLDPTIVDCFFSIIDLAYTEPKRFSKLQGISALYKEFEIKADLSLVKLHKSDELIAKLFQSILEVGVPLDIIETLNFTQFADDRSIYSIDQSLASQVTSHYFCQSIGLSNKELSTHREQTKFLTKESKSSSDVSSDHKFVEIYRNQVESMVASSDLVCRDSGTKTSLSSHVRFRFDFAKRYFEQEKRIIEWENTAGIPIDCRLGIVLTNNWGRYCSTVIDTLRKKIDFTPLLALITGDKKHVLLDEAAAGIKDAVGSINQVIDHRELQLESNQAKELVALAAANFDNLVKDNFRRFQLELERLIERGTTTQISKAVYCQFFVSQIEEVKTRLDPSIVQRADYLSPLTTRLTNQQIMTSVHQTCIDLDLDYNHESMKLFLALLYEKLAEKNIPDDSSFSQIYKELETLMKKSVSDLKTVDQPLITNLRANYPRIVPFCLLPVSTEVDSKPSVLKIDFEGFTLSEYLSQALPN